VAAVTAVGLSKHFGDVRAVDDLNIEIADCEFFSMLGPSGSGKTTVLRMVAGFEHPTKGSVLLGEQDVTALPAHRRDVNTVFQDYAIFPHMDVLANVEYGLRVKKVDRRERRRRAEEALAAVRLEGYGKRRPTQLSGGQRQRVALARALIRRPKVLLLDEPLSALDKKLREQTQLELVNIIEEVGVTCVMVTHDQEEAMTMASRIAVMSEGKVLQVGNPNDIYETPANRFVADFIGNVNLMDGTVIEDEADHVIVRCADCTQFVGHGITGTESMAVAIALRPEKIALAREAPEGPYNRAQGTVKDLAYFGSYTVYHLQLASGAMLKVSQSNTTRHRDDRLAWGDQVWASWAATSPVVLTQ